MTGRPPLTPAMHLVCNSANFPSERKRVLEALIARGAALENRDGRSCTPLHRAAGVGACVQVQVAPEQYVFSRFFSPTPKISSISSSNSTLAAAAASGAAIPLLGKTAKAAVAGAAIPLVGKRAVAVVVVAVAVEVAVSSR